MSEENERIQITMLLVKLLAKIAAEGDVAKQEVVMDEWRLRALSSVTGIPEPRLCESMARVASALEVTAREFGLTTPQVVELLSRHSSCPEETRSLWALAFKIRGLKPSG